jgi:hypothetical protein
VSGADDIVISLPDEDGDAVYVLVNILHLRNDKLPARLTPAALSKLASLAHKYQCVIAAGRATVQWFDRLYASNTPLNTWEIVEAAYLLDEPLFFARFSSLWVLQQSLFGRTVPGASSAETQKLGCKSSSSLHITLASLTNVTQSFSQNPTSKPK